MGVGDKHQQMSQLLTLTRAARLVGVTRGVLQRRIKSGELVAFEGMVTLEELLRAYPEVESRVADDAMLERLERIKDNALAKYAVKTVLPDAQTLATRATALGKELAETKAQFQHHAALIEKLAQQLVEIGRADDAQLRLAIIKLREWLISELQGETQPDRSPTRLLIRDSVLRVMAAHIRVLPSNHEFFLEGNDSILEAALRAGLALNYGCSSGNCGLCKAKVVSGQLKKIRATDYVLSVAEKAQRYELLCANTAVTDLVIEALEAHGVQDIPLQQISARVKKLEMLSGDIALLHLQTPRTKRLRFLAGQHVRLQAAHGPATTYPIASCPCDDRNLQFHVRRAERDAFSAHVFGALKSADTVNVEGPAGEFVLREDSPRSLIFIACDSGFAPIKSLIEHAMALDVAERMHLYWIASGQGGHYLDNLCRSWTDALDNFDYTSLLVPTGRSDAAQRVEEILAHVSSEHPDLAEHDVYVAAAASFADAAEFFMLDHGVPAEQLFVERLDE
jgi:CDP-4-dehydro-6-deoxyglucose reductase, E3